MNIELNSEIVKVLEAVKSNTGNLFVTGKAGTGKSTLLKYIATHSGKNTVVLAPTGLAAINVRGVTIHSFFKLPVRPMIPGDKEIKPLHHLNPNAAVIRSADIVIIDEISMVRADLLDAVDHALRLNMRNELPFGGKQVLLFGDMYQLEPIVTEGDERAFLDDYYASPYFFDAYSFRQGAFKTIELKKIYRQKDPEFIGYLNKIRTGQIDQSDLNQLNHRCYKQQKLVVDDFAVVLCTSNRIARGINHMHLESLQTEPVLFKGVIEGDFNPKNLTTPVELTLKVGAKVMILKNGIGYANGSIGILEEIEDEICRVRLRDNSLVDIIPYTWEQLRYKYSKKERKIVSEIVGTYTQMPLLHAWAITIHKSQGLTFDSVHLDLGQSSFAAGQAYVGLSRCTSLTGLSFARKLYPEDILIHPRVLEFADEITAVTKRKKIGSL